MNQSSRSGSEVESGRRGRAAAAGERWLERERDRPNPRATPRSFANPIDSPQVLASLKRGEDGAALVFEGVVRNQTRGRKTLYLDYEAYEEMALEQMESLAAQALTTIPDSRRCHRPPAGPARNRRDQRADRGCVGASRGCLRRLPMAHRYASSERCRSGRRSTSRMARCGPTASHFRRRFRAQIPETRGSPTSSRASK